MQFKSESERLKEPHAALIPPLVWQKVFLSRISKEELALMKTPLEEIKAMELSQNKYAGSSEKIKYSKNIAWLCIALGHPDASVDDLILIAKQLSLSNEELLVQAATLGNSGLIETIFQTQPDDQIRTYMHYDGFAVYKAAARYNKGSVMELIKEKVPTLVITIIKHNTYQVYFEVAENGHLHLMRYMEFCVPDIIKYVLNSITLLSKLLELCKNHREVMEYLTPYTQEFKAQVRTPQNGSSQNLIPIPKNLSRHEQLRYESLRKRYQPIIDSKGVDYLLDQLRNSLVEMYKNPPDDSQRSPFPLTWSQLVEWFPTPEKRKHTLLGYTANMYHTAWRYLLKPNPWIAADARYVETNPQDPSQKWSTFESVADVIVIFWLAAKDPEIPVIDGLTLEERIKHFIFQLAYLGRTHNYDQKRVRYAVDADNIKYAFLDLSMKPITEVYDDGKEDKPCCPTRVQYELFQAAVGQPFIKKLTTKQIIKEHRMFVREHFTKLITNENRSIFRAAFENYLRTNKETVSNSVLKELDIPKEQQDAFIKRLAAKYGDQFADDPISITLVRQMFTLGYLDSGIMDFAHAVKYRGLVGLDALLKDPVPLSKASDVGLFARPVSKSLLERREFTNLKISF